MPSDKSPGVDGYPIEFFTRNWEVVGHEIYEAVIGFFDTGKLQPLNYTAITLVPKVPSPSNVKDYRPIACCTTIYKIIAKVMTLRIKTVTGALIGNSQSAFVERMSIIDNILFSHELLKGYTRRGLSPRCVLKVT